MPLTSGQDRGVPGPPYYPPEDIAALVEYVESLGPGPPVPTLEPGDFTEGRELYLATCAACHGSSGTGTAMVDGHVAYSVLDTDPVQVAEAIRTGPGMMPPFGEDVLTDEEVESIVSYVSSLPAEDARGGWRIGGVGPVTEGLVAWLLGLGALVAVVRLLGRRAEE